MPDCDKVQHAWDPGPSDERGVEYSAEHGAEYESYGLDRAMLVSLFERTLTKRPTGSITP
jgi:hypothetical protein